MDTRVNHPKSDAQCPAINATSTAHPPERALISSELPTVNHHIQK
ncbi:hypothetical protein [Methanoplanus endosymbiosus]|nr:hypothetical protein [Methanoplanus endosymbiosus]